MKYVDEYRNSEIAHRLLDEIHHVTTRPWALMEVCGGQTHTLVKQGIDEALPAGVRMIHGPGCPVCVTPLEQIDKALVIAARPDVIFTSYGDMLRVPGSTTDLLALKARGAHVRIGGVWRDPGLVDLTMAASDDPCHDHSHECSHCWTDEVDPEPLPGTGRDRGSQRPGRIRTGPSPGGRDRHHHRVHRTHRPRREPPQPRMAQEDEHGDHQHYRAQRLQDDREDGVEARSRSRRAVPQRLPPRSPHEHHARACDRSEALADDVPRGVRAADLAFDEERQRHRRVDVRAGMPTERRHRDQRARQPEESARDAPRQPAGKSQRGDR